MLNRIKKTEDDLKLMNDNLAARVAKSGREFGLSLWLLLRIVL